MTSSSCRGHRRTATEPRSPGRGGAIQITLSHVLLSLLLLFRLLLLFLRLLSIYVCLLPPFHHIILLHTDSLLPRLLTTHDVLYTLTLKLEIQSKIRTKCTRTAFYGPLITWAKRCALCYEQARCDRLATGGISKQKNNCRAISTTYPLRPVTTMSHPKRGGVGVDVGEDVGTRVGEDVGVKSERQMVALRGDGVVSAQNKCASIVNLRRASLAYPARSVNLRGGVPQGPEQRAVSRRGTHDNVVEDKGDYLDSPHLPAGKPCTFARWVRWSVTSGRDGGCDHLAEKHKNSTSSAEKPYLVLVLHSATPSVQ